MGSDNGGRTAAILNTIVASCKKNQIDPQSYIADVLSRLADSTRAQDLKELLPGAWCPLPQT